MIRYAPRVLCLILLGLLFSCQFSDETEFQIGDNFINSTSGIVKVDTMNFYTYSVLTDSFATSSSSRILLGSQNASEAGAVSCTSYFEMTSGSFTIDDDDIVFDSLVMVMNYDKYYYGDTTKLINIDVLRLNESIELNDDDYISNKGAFSTDMTPLGSLSFNPSPTVGDTICIKLDSSLGEEFFDKIVAKNDTMSNATYFEEYFKGIAIKTTNTPDVMIGVSAASGALAPRFKIYYHEEVMNPGEDHDTKRYFTLPYNTSGLHFNHFDRSFTSSLFPNILNMKVSGNSYEISSDDTDQKVVSQGGSGVYTKIMIPGIKGIEGYAKKVVFVSATLYLYPLESSYNEKKHWPDSLAVYVADYKNVISSQLTSSSGSVVYALKSGKGQYDNTPYYSIDATSFFTSLIDEDVFTKECLLIGPTSSSLTNTAQTVVFGRKNNRLKPASLSIYCYIDKN